jgi:hypothetical protein
MKLWQWWFSYKKGLMYAYLWKAHLSWWQTLLAKRECNRRYGKQATNAARKNRPNTYTASE